ncbi:MAG: hypothetical protein R6W76_02540, partial [Caldilinea sp.]
QDSSRVTVMFSSWINWSTTELKSTPEANPDHLMEPDKELVLLEVVLTFVAMFVALPKSNPLYRIPAPVEARPLGYGNGYPRICKWCTNQSSVAPSQ